MWSKTFEIGTLRDDTNYVWWLIRPEMYYSFIIFCNVYLEHWFKVTGRDSFLAIFAQKSSLCFEQDVFLSIFRHFVALPFTNCGNEIDKSDIHFVRQLRDTMFQPWPQYKNSRGKAFGLWSSKWIQKHEKEIFAVLNSVSIKGC